MIITYHGHSTFKFKGKKGSVVTDPFDSSVGLPLSTLSADLVTVSHDHPDHSAFSRVSATSRRDKPFIITHPGEYEVGGISVFGVESFHDASQGAERGRNIIFTVLIDELRVCHLGDLGHELSVEQVEAIGSVDVLLCPVGGIYTVDPETAVKVIRALEPSIAIPMHYKTPQHNQETFGELKTVEDFLKEYGVETVAEPKFEISKAALPEETEVVVLRAQ